MVEEEKKEDERSYFPGEIKVNRVLYLLVFHLFHCFTIVQLSRKLLYLNLLYIGHYLEFLRRFRFNAPQDISRKYIALPYGPGETKMLLSFCFIVRATMRASSSNLI